MIDGVVVGLGEVLWDIFKQDGSSADPSEKDEYRFGGAPANFAHHAQALGAKVAMVSAVGPDEDPLAAAALDQLRRSGIETRFVFQNEFETGRVVVRVDSSGHPHYAFSPQPAWNAIPWTETLGQLARQTRAVCFGTLAQYAAMSRATIQRFLAEVPDGALKAFDVNLRVNYWTLDTIAASLQRANVLKLNDEELPAVMEASGFMSSPFSSSEGEAVKRLVGLRDKYALRAIAFTKGAQGATLITQHELDHCPAPPTQVCDTVGAGDSYTAALILGLLKGWDAATINRRAVDIAAYVCTQRGATPVLPARLTLPFVQP